MSRASPRFKRVNPSLPAVGSTNGVIVYQIRGAIEGQLTISSFFYSAPVPAPTPGQLTSLRVAASTALRALYAACLSADWGLTIEVLNVVHRNDIFGNSSTANVPLAGGRTAGHLPTEVAMVLNKTTAVKGQHGRGRVGLPAVAIADVTASRITAGTLLTALGNLGTAMLGGISDGTNTWTPCLAQRGTSSPKLVIGFSALTSVATNTLLGTVRRRKIGRGK